MTYTIEMEYEQVDAIVVQELKEQYRLMKESLEQRQSGEEKIGIFVTDIDADIVEIQSHIDALAKVLSYNMRAENFIAFVAGYSKGDE